MLRQPGQLALNTGLNVQVDSGPAPSVPCAPGMTHRSQLELLPSADMLQHLVCQMLLQERVETLLRGHCTPQIFHMASRFELLRASTCTVATHHSGDQLCDLLVRLMRQVRCFLMQDPSQGHILRPSCSCRYLREFPKLSKHPSMCSSACSPG